MRDGRVCFDIGWVGCLEGGKRVDDGLSHAVSVGFENGSYSVTVDGFAEAGGLERTRDQKGAEVRVGIEVWHEVGGRVMAGRFEGSVRSVVYKERGGGLGDRLIDRLPPPQVAIAVPSAGENTSLPVAEIAVLGLYNQNPRPSAPPSASSPSPPGSLASFRSVNYPLHTWNALNSEKVEISQQEGRPSLPFRIVPGLKASEGYSFEDADRPGWYLRHCNYYLRMHERDGTELFDADATFFQRPALSGDAEAVSWESLNYRSHFIGHRSYRLKICESLDSKLHRNDASFFLEGEGS